MKEMEAIKFTEGKLILLDQTKLPIDVSFVECNDFMCVAQAIKEMKVRGAPAIGVAAAYGLVLAAYEYKNLPQKEFLTKIREAATVLKETRPTAVNLFWALNRMLKVLEKEDILVKDIIEKLEIEAQKFMRKTWP